MALAGCATPGPLHVYSLNGSGAQRHVLDAGSGRRAHVPSFLTANDHVSGFAYDPFTDHFFLRLHPGNRIRVVDRPARAIKREFEITHPGTLGGGDLTVRPHDGHLFLLGGAAHGSVIETTRLGKVTRIVSLSGVGHAPVGIAYDTTKDHLLVLAADGSGITVHDLHGARVNELTLAHAVRSSLAFDAEKNEIYAPLRDDAGEIGVFNENGRLLRTTAGGGEFVDVGMRSFVRVF